MQEREFNVCVCCCTCRLACMWPTTLDDQVCLRACASPAESPGLTHMCPAWLSSSSSSRGSPTSRALRPHRGAVWEGARMDGEERLVSERRSTLVHTVPPPHAPPAPAANPLLFPPLECRRGQRKPAAQAKATPQGNNPIFGPMLYSSYLHATPQQGTGPAVVAHHASKLGEVDTWCCDDEVKKRCKLGSQEEDWLPPPCCPATPAENGRGLAWVATMRLCSCCCAATSTTLLRP